MTAVELVARLAGAKPDKGGYAAFCPAHEGDGDEHKPSLSVKQANDRVLVHCHAGCSTDAVLGALGLHARDLFSDAATKPTNGKRPTAKLGPIVACYDYHDEHGTLLHQTTRHDNTPKEFRQRRPDGAGGFIWNLDGVRHVLYRLPELADITDVCPRKVPPLSASRRSCGPLPTPCATTWMRRSTSTSSWA